MLFMFIERRIMLFVFTEKQIMLFVFIERQIMLFVLLPASWKAKAGIGVQSLRPSVCLSVCLSVPKSCHRNASETTDQIIMKLGM